MIIELDDKLISTAIFEEYFVCDIAECHGMCCVYGDSGAPLEEGEMEIIEKDLEKIAPYLKPEGLKAVKEQGIAIMDYEGDLVTPLIDGDECAYSYYSENGICFCGIEKAYLEKKTKFRKPISCHLYPIRTKMIGGKMALNYDQWSICHCAREKGKREKVLVFEFLKEPIVRKFGKKFYKELEKLYKQLKNSASLQ